MSRSSTEEMRWGWQAINTTKWTIFRETRPHLDVLLTPSGHLTVLRDVSVSPLLSSPFLWSRALTFGLLAQVLRPHSCAERDGWRAQHEPMSSSDWCCGGQTKHLQDSEDEAGGSMVQCVSTPECIMGNREKDGRRYRKEAFIKNI